ncbi:ATP-binding protein [Microbacteriaceae bacterium 4G12]
MFTIKNKNIKRILALAILTLLFFSGFNVLISYLNIKKSVEISLANQGVEMAKSIASSIDTETYERFLEEPVTNQAYWKVREYLNDARLKTGALYVYTIRIDSPRKCTALIAGMPNDVMDGFGIGEPCTVPYKQLELAYAGKTYYTKPIKDPKYGNYVSAGAPIKNEKGKIIGYLGVDISTSMLNGIEEKVMSSSISHFIFNGAFVFIILACFFIIQRWYHKELKKEVGDTEDTYQSEFRSLLSSVQSLRHDFMNHIQVLHGLLKLGSHQQALEYATSLMKEVKSIEPIKLNVSNPALLVLFQTKKLTAQNQNVMITFDVSDHSFDRMKTTDLIKVLSNLIDNGIEAATELSEQERRIKIICKADEKGYLFEIINTGPNIQEKDKEHIFESGYSTKKAKQGKVRGQGLFIVKEIVTKYKGEIGIESYDGETTVTIRVPVQG